MLTVTLHATADNTKTLSAETLICGQLSSAQLAVVGQRVLSAGNRRRVPASMLHVVLHGIAMVFVKCSLQRCVVTREVMALLQVTPDLTLKTVLTALCICGFIMTYNAITCIRGRSRKIPRISRNTHMTTFTTVPPPPPAYPQSETPDPVHRLPSYLFMFHFSIILPYTPLSSKRHVFFGFPHQNSVRISLLPHSCNLPVLSHLCTDHLYNI
jgi:hypothetical protein